MAYKNIGTKKTGLRGKQMSRASWARIDRSIEKATRREGKRECAEYECPRCMDDCASLCHAPQDSRFDW